MNKKSWIILIILTVLAFFLTPTLPQDEAYHNFADTRHLLICSNSWDVFSNLPFIIFGIAGVISTFTLPVEKILKLYLQTFFIGSILVGLGSGYYHITPNSQTLVWDRLPMTISFMSLICLIMHILDMPELARKLFPILMPIGILSVVYWAFTNDLRPYVLVQFVPMIWIPWKLYKATSPCKPYLWNLIIFYTLAKVFEAADKIIYSLSGEIISGHSIKHLSASLSILMVFLMLKKINQQPAVPLEIK